MDVLLEKKLKVFFKKVCPHETNVQVEPLAGDGSLRVFWRVRGKISSKTFVAMSNPPLNEDRLRENRAYLMIGKHLRQKGVLLPEIHDWDLDSGFFVMEDLGDRSLQDVAALETDPVPVYTRLVEQLIRFQIDGFQDFDPEWCCQTPRYDRRVMRRYESDYFRKAFLRGYLGIDKPFRELEKAFDFLAEKAGAADTHFLMHRDFQSRNIMVSNEKIGFIDWQGSRLGPLAYDLASLLIDPYTDLTRHQKQQIYDHYVEQLKDENLEWAASVERNYPYLALQRNLQILGAFGFLTRVRKKQWFEQYIPSAVSSLCALLEMQQDAHLKPLKSLMKEMGGSAA
jgi:aminoglycoside/choline kinase family phosphotransferase